MEDVAIEKIPPMSKAKAVATILKFILVILFVNKKKSANKCYEIEILWKLVRREL